MKMQSLVNERKQRNHGTKRTVRAALVGSCLLLMGSITACGGKASGENTAEETQTEEATVQETVEETALAGTNEETMLGEPELGDYPENWMEEKTGQYSFTSYDEIISYLDKGNAYAYVKVMGAEEPILLISEESFSGYGFPAVMNAYPYLKAEDGTYRCGSYLFTDSTSTPIAVTEDGQLMCATHYGMEKQVITDEFGSQAIMDMSSVSVEWDANIENGTYYGFYRTRNSVQEEPTEVEGEEAEKMFNAYFEEFTEDCIIPFTVVE